MVTAHDLVLLAPLLLMAPLAATSPLPAELMDISTEVTNIPDSDQFEHHAQQCMQEANVTQEQVHAAFEEDPNHIPHVLKCLWGCMYRKIGMLVDGRVSKEVPSGVLEDRLHELEVLKTLCDEKVAATTDECDKGAILRECAIEITTTTSPPTA